MKIKKFLIPLFLIGLLLIPSIVLAQEPSITIRMSRDNGYGGFNNDIQGTFTIKASSDEVLSEVRFYVDEELMGILDSEPYNLQFHTGNYSPGVHTLYVIGVLPDGSELRSNEKIQNFLSGEEALSSTLNLLVPILLVVGLLALGGAVLPALLGKKGKTMPVGEYGVAGGSVCTKCELPFSRNILSPNLIVGKLSRCPHCGKWQIARRAFGENLAAAEDRLKSDNQEGQIETFESEEDRLRKSLDDSQFDN